MNLIDHLHSTLTPKILELVSHYEGSEQAKRGALSHFFALFSAKLVDFDVLARINNLSADDIKNSNRLLDAVFKDNNGSLQLATLNDELAKEHHLPKQTVDALTAISAPLVYEEMKSLAGTRTLPVFLRGHINNIATHLPNWASKLLPLTLLTKDSSFAKSLLPIIGLVIFAGLAWLLLRACQEQTTPVAAPPVAITTESTTVDDVSINTTPATFSLAMDDTGESIYSCRGAIGGQNTLTSINNALSGVFGVTNDKCQLDTVLGVADTLPASEHLTGIFGLMKGMPNASISIRDKVIRFNATNADDIASLIDKTKALVPADFVVEAEPELNVADAVTQSISSAKTAITELTDTATADDLVHALNLQIINFATASSEIPAENKEILNLAAAKLIALPDTKLNIIGHTDSQGSHESNKTLSEQRAKAVHDYLVSQGVPDERLEIFGASFDRPVATNATEQGRFQNRRIEFTLIKDGEQIASVGSQNTSTTDVSDSAKSQP